MTKTQPAKQSVDVNEVHLARLTAHSKNTFASANSLEYSASPKKLGDRDPTPPV